MALATAPAGSVRKAARPSLAAALADGGWAATTVSATMIAAHAAGIVVFATGGIGGVHRGALGGGPSTPPASFDISSDLEELGRTPMAVVCAGPKAILDVPATLEYLETRGVPVIALGQTDLPGFYARSAGIAAPSSAAGIADVAAVVSIQLGLELGAGVLVCVPVPEGDALPDDVAREAVERAVADATREGIAGPALTPWLLARIAVLTDGASIRANTALIVNDARVAGELADEVDPGLIERCAGASPGGPGTLPLIGALVTLGPARYGLPDSSGDPDRMRIYEGSPRQDFEEVFRSIGAFLDQRGMRDILLLEAPDGFIVQGLVVAGGGTGSWSESVGTQTKETLTFLDEDIARFMEEASARRGTGASATPAGRYEAAFRVIGRYMDDQKPHDVFFFEQEGAFVLRLLMSGQAGSRHELAEFTRDDIDDMVARGPSLRHTDAKATT